VTQNRVLLEVMFVPGLIRVQSSQGTLVELAANWDTGKCVWIAR